MGGNIHAMTLSFDVEDEKGRVQHIEARETTWHEVVETITLNPGESLNGEYNLSKTANFKPGSKYHISAVYRYYGSKGEAVQLRSHSVSLIRTEPEGTLKLRREFYANCLSFEGKPIADEVWDADNDYFYLDMGFEKRYLNAVRKFPDYPASKYLAYYLAKYYHRKHRFDEALPLLKYVNGQRTFALSDDALLLSFKCGMGRNEKDGGKAILVNLLENFPDGNCAWEARRLTEDMQ